MSLFHKLERKREDNGIAVYNVVINGLCKNCKVNEAHAIFEKLSFIGLLPDVRTYIVMTNGFFLEGLLAEAKNMLRKMKDNNCFPNNVTYNVIVQGFLRCNKISDVTTFMKEMAGRGFSFDATTTGYLKLMAIRTLLELSRQPIEEVAAGEVAGTGMVAPSYVFLASDFMYNYMSRDVKASFGYDYILWQQLCNFLLALENPGSEMAVVFS
ncbi:hypothetical protein K7X08_020379 [Anisodus acutangulus]|uniref:Pentatricopeptide repeat-containing protein n=1 Tax=Anisodus acutangulus TaxID=402998 RepID=A0A9Q1M9L8_9SOLA|nr:hypothetical protein K7X08_020379 [Anisodus acutangulus]